MFTSKVGVVPGTGNSVGNAFEAGGWQFFMSCLPKVECSPGTAGSYWRNASKAPVSMASAACIAGEDVGARRAFD